MVQPLHEALLPRRESHSAKGPLVAYMDWVFELSQ
jgi:hypothetical protein